MRTIHLALILGLLIMGGLAPAATITVESGGGGDHTTITEALDAAAAGDLILVGPGTYAETVVVATSVTLRSTAGSATTTIEGPGANQDALTIEADDVNLEGFTLTAGRRGLHLDAVAGFQALDVVVEETGSYPVSLPASLVTEVVPMLGLAGHTSGQFDAVLVRTGTLTHSQTWPVLPAGFVYYLESATVTVADASGPVLTIPDGTIVKLWFSRFEIGSSSLPGGLMANDVLFTSIRDDEGGDTNGSTTLPNAGNWNRLDFNAQARTDSSRVTNSELRYGGGGTGTVEIRDSDPLLSGNTFRDNVIDLYVNGSLSDGADQTGNAIIQGEGRPIYTTLSSLDNLVFGNTLTPRGDDKWNGIGILSSDVLSSYTLPVLPFDFVYYLDSAVIDVAGPAGPVLTIPDGTIIKSWFSRFEIGSGSEPGGLVANDVTFTSVRDDVGGDTNGTTFLPASGNWNRLDFNPMARADSSRVTNCDIRYGGGGTAAVEVRNSDPVISGNTFSNNQTDLRVSGSASLGANQTGNTIVQGDNRPIATPIDHLDNIVFGNTITPRGDDKWNAVVIMNSTVSSSYTLPILPHGFVYYLDSAVIDVVGPAGPVLTIPDGTIIKSWFSRFEIGSGSEPGGLMANDVTFTSVRDDIGGDSNGSTPQPAPGNWNQLDFNSGARADSSSVTNCQFLYGGGGPATVEVNGSDPVVTGNTFADCNSVLKISGTASLGANQTGNTLTQADDRPITTTLDHLENVVLGNTIVPRGDDVYNGINIMTSQVSQDLTLPVLPHGFVYFLDSATITVSGPESPILTIPDGTIIKNWFGRFEIGSGSDRGGLIATNTIFTSSRDDIGGDTNGNNNQPAPGNWYRLDFNPTANTPVSRLTNCEIRYGGSGIGAVEARQSSPTLDRCLIRDSAGPAVVSHGAGAQPALRLCRLENNEVGLYAYNDGFARLIRTCFVGNSEAGLEVEPPSAGLGTFEAVDCWWGSADGPSGEGPGTGDAIVGPASFSPWYTTEACLDASGAPDGDLPMALSLDGAYPNPFNPSTTIAFALPAEQEARLSVFGLDGALVRTLVHDTLAAGRHEVSWDGRDEQGRVQAAGVYFYRLSAGAEVRTAKMMLIK